MYNIKQYSYDKAKHLGVIIKPSTNKNKKIDVFNSNGKKISSIGAINYKDYPTYIQEKGIDYANERKRLYHLRHKIENDIKDGRLTNSFWAKYLLW